MHKIQCYAVLLTRECFRVVAQTQPSPVTHNVYDLVRTGAEGRGEKGV